MKLSSRIIARILTLCGISLTCTACYGIPQADYMMRIEGLVTAEETGAPIEGISIQSKVLYREYGDSEYHKTTVESDRYGQYVLYEGSPFAPVITITAEDIDGVENGGEFASQTIEITLDHSDFHEIDKYNLETLKRIDFSLKRIK